MTTPESNDTPSTPSSAANTPEGWLARVERIYFEVAAVAPADREEAITRLCQGDRALEAEVREMVRSAAQLGSFLDQPALGKQFDQLDTDARRAEMRDELIGSTLGSFTVKRRIASGGMGTVYEAVRTDGQFAQTVAIKVVKRGMDSEEILRRFRTERQTLAALDHPNIARLIDGGMTADGRPFVVMEHVDGVPLDVYCDGKGLGLRERLKLFQDVCAGVQHAHQNLVIHRDIKPSNILVTAAGVPKLLDFGIAKVISGGTTRDHQFTTADADRRLTPEYASPEQVEGGALTTASDVYSLGVVLYELLTGTRPYHFGMRTSEEVRRVVCLLPPLPPSQAVTVRATRLRGTTTPKVSPENPRKSTVDTDTTAPTTSQPGSTIVDVPKTRGMTSTRLRGLLRGDLDVIVLMALRKEPLRRYASVDQFSSDIGRFLGGMPVLARRDTLGYRVSKFVRRHAVGVSLAAAAFLMLSVATTMLYRQGQQLKAQRSDLIAANARLDENLKRLTESRRFLQTVLSGADTGNQGPDARLGDVLKDAVATLRASPPADPLTLAAAEQEMGRSMMSLGMLSEATSLLVDVDRLYASLPPTSDARMDTAINLAELQFYKEQYADAEKRFRELLAMERGKGLASPSERESIILNNLGAAVRLQGRADEALQLQREALQATISAVGAGSLAAAETRNNIASSLFQKGEFAEAVKEFSASLDARKKQLRPGHPLIVKCQSNLGLALLRAGRAEEAVPLLQEATAGWEAAFGPEHPGRVPASVSLAQALRAVTRPAEALDVLRRTLSWQQSHQPNAPSIATTEANVGLAHLDLGNDVEARATLDRVVPLLRTSFPASSILRSSVEGLAGLYERTGDSAKARELLDSLPRK